MMNFLKTIVLISLFSLAGCAAPERPDPGDYLDQYEPAVFTRDHFIVTGIPETTRAYNEEFYLVEKSYLRALKGQADTLLEKYKIAQDQIEDLTKAINDRNKAKAECDYQNAQRQYTIELMERKAARDNLIGMGKQFTLAAVCALLLINP